MPKRSIDERSRCTATKPIIGDSTRKGRICKIIVFEIIVQKTKKATMLRTGSSRIDRSFLHLVAVEVALKTKNLSVTTAAKPKRLSFTQSNQPNQKLKPTPKKMKTSHIPQQTADNAKVRLIENIGSFLSRDLLTIMLVRYVIAKREMPRVKLLNERKSKRVERLIAMMQRPATTKRVFLYDGRENIEE